MVNKDRMIIFVICILVGIILSFQIKIVQERYLKGKNPNIRASELVEEYDTLKEQKEELEIKVKDYEERLSKIESEASSENALLNDLKNQLNRYKVVAGYTEVEGQGIELILDDPVENFNNSYNIVYEYDLILQVINELNAAGAEAISINEERITAYSEIRTAGNYISINNSSLKPPFRIKCIGNIETLHGSLSQRFGVVSRIRDKGYQADISKVDRLTIGPYTKDIEFNYASPVVED